MLKLYKGLYAGYFITALLGALLLIFLLLCAKQSLVIGIIFALIWVLACAVFFKTTATQRYNKNTYTAYCDCHIRDFIAENELLLSKSRNQVIRNFLMLNLFSGYYQLGSLEQARQALLQIKPNFGTKANGIMNSSVYYSGLATLYTADSYFERAKQAIASLEALLSSTALQDGQRALIRENIEIRSMRLDIKQNNYDGAKKLLALRFAMGSFPLEKVSASYELANICLHFDEKEEALMHLHYVVENGGDTFYVGKANALLEKLSDTHDALEHT